MSERQAFLAMRIFLKHFYAQVGNDMETLIEDITFGADGHPQDPGAWEDWMKCVEQARRSAP